MEIAKKIYNIITTLLVTVAVLLALLLGGVRLFGYTPYAVLSGSMEPTYPVGALIYVKEVVAEEVSVGDPITFVLNEDLVVATHRVVEVRGEDEQFITKGDANQNVDAAPVHFNNLLGRPEFHIPWLGYLSSFISTKRGMIVGGCALLCVIILLFFPDILKALDGKEEGAEDAKSVQ